MTIGSMLYEGKAKKVFATDKPDLASYGLDKPAITVSAKLAGGQAIGVMLGGQNPRKTSASAGPSLGDGSPTVAPTFQKRIESRSSDRAPADS